MLARVGAMKYMKLLRGKPKGKKTYLDITKICYILSKTMINFKEYDIYSIIQI